jgi:CheY-specific phosphatase CheX/anti-anti-sigma regulatory factor
MRPIIKNSIAVFHPQGFLDGNNAPFVIGISDRNFVLQKKCDAVLVSLKKVVFFNKNGITMLVDILRDIRDKIDAVVGFCDYDVKKYKTIFDMFKNDLDFSLFENMEIASLFAGPSKKCEDTKVLVYSDDGDQKNQLAIELYERGYSTTIAKDKDFLKSKRDSFQIVIENSYLGIYSSKIAAHIKDNIVVYTLQNYIDSNVSSAFDLNYHQNSLKVGFKLFVFDATRVSSMNVHGVNFLSKLSISAAEYGATICIAGLKSEKITNRFKNELEDSGILLYDSLYKFFEDNDIKKESGGAAVNIRTKALTKDLISALPMFTEAAICTIEAMSSQSAQKSMVEIQKLKIDSDKKFFSSSIALYGDIECMIVLVFPISLAKKSCALLIEEDDKEEDVLDALGEFVNIIGGKTKALLAKEGINVNITLPRTFAKVEDILDTVENNKGVQIDFLFDSEPLHFFLTK